MDKINQLGGTISAKDLGQGLYGKGFATDPKPKAEGLYSAEGLLEDGLKVLSERGKQYDPAGKSERSMEKIVAAFALITGKKLTEAEGWMFMAVLKQVRSFQRPGFHADSAQDFVCYSALYGEAKAKEGGPQGQVLTKVATTKDPLEEAREMVKNPPAEVGSFWTRTLSEEARNEIRCRAYGEYLKAAKLLQVRCASSWHDMHPAEQKSWLSRVLGTDTAGIQMLIIDPIKRVKDPDTGLDLPLEKLKL